MMHINEIDIDQDEFDQNELDAMVEILDKAEKIKRDGPLFRMLQQHMKKQSIGHGV